MQGQKCHFKYCKSCCRVKTSTEVVDCIGRCPGHGGGRITGRCLSHGGGRITGTLISSWLEAYT